MMTRNEAEERATKIWPGYTELRRPALSQGEWYAVVDKNGDYHTMDGNGHTTCHPACARIEEKLP